MLELYDLDGRLQISADMLGFVCRKTGTGATQTKLAGNTNPSSFLVDIPAGYTYPIVAFQLSGGGTGALVYNQGAGGQAQFACDRAVGTAFNYYIFDWTVNLPAHNAPRQIWDANGNLVFSSDYFSMLATPGAASRGDINYAVACTSFGGQRVAGAYQCIVGGQVVIDEGYCQQYRWRNEGEVYGGSISADYHSVTPASVKWDYVTATSGDPPPADWVVQNTILAIDVTDIPIGATFF